MRLDDFDYHLPTDRIAQHPLAERDSARLLVDAGARGPIDRVVRDLPEYVREGDVLVVNDSRVIPARIRLRRSTGGAVEVLLLEPVSADRLTWEVMVRPARRLRPGEQLFLDSGSPAFEVQARTAAGDTHLVSLLSADEPLEFIGEIGEMPLPPYIKERLDDPDRYQTVYARDPGSAAAPTAGLHLTDTVLDDIRRRGVEVLRVELMVGLDTFKPVSASDPRDHKIHTERFRVSPDVLEKCRTARRVFAVGTTTARTLETAAATGVLEGRTDIFIYRPYQWKMVDALMTNFHLPRTTLIMMVDAFVGPRWRELYEEALRRGYRFLSFGDSMLLFRGEA